MAIKKVISSKKSLAPMKEELVPIKEETEKAFVEETSKFAKKVCPFCQAKSKPSYTDLATLKRFLSDRAKITAKSRSGVCARHQRAVAKNIKYARHLSLLPFVPQV